MDDRNSLCAKDDTTTSVENIDSNFAIIVTVADCAEEFGKVFERVFSGEAFEIDSLRVLVAGDDILNMVSPCALLDDLNRQTGS